MMVEMRTLLHEAKILRSIMSPVDVPKSSSHRQSQYQMGCERDIAAIGIVVLCEKLGLASFICQLGALGASNLKSRIVSEIPFHTSSTVNRTMEARKGS